MDFVDTAKKRICESNKKVSFSQKSSVGTKSAAKDIKFDYLGQSFSIYEGEIIESALFIRTTRDCKGETIREESIRRFRKVGSDEWFSVLAAIGNDAWNNYFEEASDEQAVEQGEKNKEDMEKENTDVTLSLNDRFEIVNPFEVEKKRLADAKKKKNIIILAIGVGILIAYRVYKKNKK